MCEHEVSPPWFGAIAVLSIVTSVSTHRIGRFCSGSRFAISAAGASIVRVKYHVDVHNRVLILAGLLLFLGCVPIHEPPPSDTVVIEAPPSRERPAASDARQCADAHRLGPEPEMRTCELLGARPITVDVRSDPAHCGECFRACEGCADGECPPGSAITVRIAGARIDAATDLAARDGTIAVSGTFGRARSSDGDRNIDLGDGALESRGGLDAFVVVLDAELRRRWGLRVGGPEEDSIRRVAIAPDGSIVVAGSFVDEIRIGSGDPIPGQQRDAFVARLGSDGALRSIVMIGGPGHEHALALAIDDAGRVYAGGSYGHGALSIGGVSIPGPEVGAWIASFGVDGTTRWARALGGGSRSDQGWLEQAGIDDLVLTADGSLFVVGSFVDAIELPGDLTSAGAFDGFVARMDLDGRASWARPVFATERSDSAYRALVVGGSVLVSGSTQATGRLEPDTTGTVQVEADGRVTTAWSHPLALGAARWREASWLATARELVRIGDDPAEPTTEIEVGPALEIRDAAALGSDLYLAGSAQRPDPQLPEIAYDHAHDVVVSRMACDGRGCPRSLWYPSLCDIVPVACGDGVRATLQGEACDDGERNGERGSCAFHCFSRAERCGDAVIQEGEACDVEIVPPREGYWCNDCAIVAERCGDGRRWPGEICLDAEPTLLASGAYTSVDAANADPQLIAVDETSRRFLALDLVGPELAPTVRFDHIFSHRISAARGSHGFAAFAGGECDDCATLRAIPSLLPADGVPIAMVPDWLEVGFDDGSSPMAIASARNLTFTAHAAAPSTIAHGVDAIGGVLVASEPFDPHVIVVGVSEVARFEIVGGSPRTLAASASWRTRTALTSPIDAIERVDLDGDGQREIIVLRGDPTIAQRFDPTTGMLLPDIAFGTGRTTFARALQVSSPEYALLIGEDGGALHAYLPRSNGAAGWHGSMPCTVRDASSVSWTAGAATLEVYFATDCGLYRIRPEI